MAKKKITAHVLHNLQLASNWLAERKNLECLPLVHPAHWIISDTLHHLIRGVLVRYVYKIDLVLSDDQHTIRIFRSIGADPCGLKSGEVFEVPMGAFVQMFKKVQAENKLRDFTVKSYEVLSCSP